MLNCDQEKKTNDLSTKLGEKDLNTSSSLQLRDAVIEAILDRKGENVVSLDLTKINDAVTDHFVICDATTTVQVKAIAQNIVDHVKEHTGERPWHKEGYENLDWVLLDYVDVVVHIFRTEIREFYQLEELWADADRKEYE